MRCVWCGAWALRTSSDGLAWRVGDQCPPCPHHETLTGET